MAKNVEAVKTPEIAENVTVQIARDGAIIPKSTDSERMRDLTDDVMRGIGETGDAFADAVAIAEQLYGSVQELAEEFGSGFQLIETKAALVGKKFLLLKWNFTQGDYGVYVSAAVVTAEGGKYIINDGSTGVCQQLHEYSVKHGKFGGFIASRGLRESTYATCKACGAPRSSFDETCANQLPNGSTCGDADTARGAGNTFYLDLSA